MAGWELVGAGESWRALSYIPNSGKGSAADGVSPLMTFCARLVGMQRVPEQPGSPAAKESS